MQTTYKVPRSATARGFVMATASIALFLGGVGGYIVKSLQFQSAETVAASAASSRSGAVSVDAITGYPSGSAADQRLLVTLREVGYEGGATVIRVAVDPITGFPFGSAEDQRTIEMLKQAGYEGGATIVHGR